MTQRHPYPYIIAQVYLCPIEIRDLKKLDKDKQDERENWGKIYFPAKQLRECVSGGDCGKGRRVAANNGILYLHYKLWHIFNGKISGNVCASENAEIM